MFKICIIIYKLYINIKSKLLIVIVTYNIRTFSYQKFKYKNLCKNIKIINTELIDYLSTLYYINPIKLYKYNYKSFKI